MESELTSNELSIELKARGYDLSPATVRQWWTRGAPKDPDAFLDFYETHRMSNKLIPRRNTDYDPLYRCADMMKSFLGRQPEELDAAIGEALQYLIDHQDTMDPKRHFHGSILVLSMQHAIKCAKNSGVFALVFDNEYRPGRLTPELRRSAKAFASGEAFNFEEALKDCRLSMKDFVRRDGTK